MAQFVCFNSAGKTSTDNSNKLTSLYQYDSNRTLVIRGIPKDDSDTILLHFGNSKDPDMYVVSPEVYDDYISSVIPNELLMKPDTIVVYIVAESATDGVRTIGSVNIPVVPRPVPSDYIYMSDISGAIIADGLVANGSTVYLSNQGNAFGDGEEV